MADSSPRTTASGSTIADVARAAGVSTATAARALGSYGSVSQRTRERVTQAAAALGYQRNELAATMITGRSNTLGLLIADIENPFFAAAARGVTDVAHEAGYEVVLVNTDENLATERSAMRVLVAKRLDGIVVAAASPFDVEHLAAAQQLGCPVVLLDRRVQGLDADVVLVDNLGASRDVVERLLAAGHRRIGIVTGGASSADQAKLDRPSVSTGRDRVDGFLAAMSEAGIPDPTTYLRTGAHNRALAEELTRGLLELPEPPTALFTTDSVLGLGALRALRAAGVDIPRRVSLVTFDDADWTSVVAPAISVVAQPALELGRAAAQALLRRIAGSDDPVETQIMSTTFIDRESIATPSTT